MTDNNTPNTTQQANTPPEGNGTAGKMFTQEEVNSIVKDRLARERAKGQTSGATDNSAAELDTEKAQLEAAKCLARQQREVVIPEIDAYTYGIMCTLSLIHI